MTSTITGLPDRYRPLDEVGPEESTPTGLIRCWRAKDRVLNRDVAIRVHTPGGPAAHAWIARALTAGGLATPALAMVYDAAEGGADESGSSTIAYVVNEWIDGETLAERLARGPMPERETRTLLRRLAEGVAEAHRVGLAVGGLSPQQVVLRPNGLVGLRSVPAASGTVQGDIAALGALLEACLTGRVDGAEPPRIAQPDLAALVRRARSTEPGQGLSSVAAMAALLADRPRSARVAPEPVHPEDADNGWLRRLRERRTEAAPSRPEPAPAGDARPVRVGPDTLPPVPPTRAIAPADVEPMGRPAVQAPPVRNDYDDADDEQVVADVFGAGLPDDFPDDLGDDLPEDEADATPARRRRLVTVGVPVAALALVIALAWWLGSNVLSVAGSVDEGTQPPPPAASATSATTVGGLPAALGKPAPIAGAAVFDPQGDGQPENDSKVPLSHDGDPTTAWPTLDYRGSATFGNLKDGVGVSYDLGSSQGLSGVTLTTTTPGATVEIRVADRPSPTLDGWQKVAGGKLTGTTDLRFGKPVTARYVLVWITQLVPGDGAFHADIAEIAVHRAA